MINHEVISYILTLFLFQLISLFPALIPFVALTEIIVEIFDNLQLVVNVMGDVIDSTENL